MIWGGNGERRGTGGREGQGPGTGTDERDWDRDIAKNVALLIWGGNGKYAKLNSN